MSPAKLSAQIEGYEEKIRTIDAMSQEGFRQIKALAEVALLGLESESRARSLEAFAGVFEAIRSIAGDVENSINSEAEEVGCNYEDQAQRRRFAGNLRSTDSADSGRA